MILCKMASIVLPSICGIHAAEPLVGFGGFASPRNSTHRNWLLSEPNRMRPRRTETVRRSVAGWVNRVGAFHADDDRSTLRQLPLKERSMIDVRNSPDRDEVHMGSLLRPWATNSRDRSSGQPRLTVDRDPTVRRHELAAGRSACCRCPCHV